ncbi:MAG: filamentous hemagglutinin N-terminal domain-containing protein, partial [Pseudomonadota bacterium]
MRPCSNTTRLMTRVSTRALIAGGMTALAIAPQGPALAGPQGGQVQTGQASIAQHGKTTTVDQSTQRVSINWDSFDTAPDETVRFEQPNAASIALNRVVNGQETHFRGALEANGNVWVVNRSGVVFHETSRVDVGGLLATTNDIPDTDFQAGNFDFSIQGEPGAKVINQGQVTVKEAGLAALVAPGVENHGAIVATMGTVVLGGEEVPAIDLAGDGMIAFELGGDTSVVNTGAISADGGHVLISAETAGTLLDRTVSLGGSIQAETKAGHAGRISVDAGEGRLDVTGTLSASGTETGSEGGTISLMAEGIWLDYGAGIDVSGDAGGGTAHIGGTARGGGTGQRARQVQVAETARIAADATGETGNGGEIIVFAEGTTAFWGTLSATGGTLGGDGGFAEVSGLGFLHFDGTADLTAAEGFQIGELLFDPTDLVIADNNVDPGGDIAFDDAALDLDGVTSTIDADLIAGLGAAVILEAERDITVDQEITTANDLTLRAGNDILINENITVTDGTNDPTLSLIADANLVSTQPMGTDIPSDGDGTVVFGVNGLGDPVSVLGDITVIETGEVLDIGNITADTLTVTALGAITDAGTLDVTGTASFFAQDGADTFNITLDTVDNGFGTLVATGDAVTVEIGTGLTLGAVDAASLGVTAAGAITDVGTLDIAGLASFTAEDGADRFAITLDTAANSFGTLAATGDAVTIDIDAALALGAIDAEELDIRAGGAITD